MIIEDSMVSLAKRYTKLEFHEKTKRYYGTCPFCHSGADMFCADNKNGVFWCYACGKHGNMDDFKILMGQEKPEMPQEPDDEELQTMYEAAAVFYFRYLMEHRDSDAFRYHENEETAGKHTFRIRARLRPGGKRDAVSVSIGTIFRTADLCFRTGQTWEGRTAV